MLKQKKRTARVPFTVEFDREEDGRWIAEVRELPGVMAYESTKQVALRRVYAIALRTLADKAEEGHQLASLSHFFLMTWRAAKARRVLIALLKIGWRIKRQKGSHRILERSGWPDITFAFHESEEIVPKMLSRIAKRTGLSAEDL